MKPNILFVNPPTLSYTDLTEMLSGTSRRYQIVTMPLGLMYISSYLKKYAQVNKISLLDYVANIKDLSKYGSVEDFITGVAKKYVSFEPDIIAFSLIFSPSHKFFITCLKILKSLWPKATTVVGGTHATNCTEFLLANTGVDYVGRGEAELGFCEFVKQFSSGRRINIKGFYCRQVAGKSKPLELCDYPQNLDELPFPDTEILDIAEYFGNRGRNRNIDKPQLHASIMTTRGCPFQCTFCSSYTVHGRTVRMRSVENVIAEARLLYEKYGVNVIIPEDDVFTIDRKRTVKLLGVLREMGIPDFELQFPNGLSVNTLDEEVIDALIASGMKIASIAIESGSEFVQRYIIKKHCNLQKAKWIIQYLLGKGINTRCFFILGFPGETLEQMLQTIEFAKSASADWSVFMIAMPLIGSHIYEQFRESGYIKNDIEFWSEQTAYDKRLFDTKEVPAVKLNELVYRANIECNFIGNPNIRKANFKKALAIFQDVVQLYPYHIIGWDCILGCFEYLGKEKMSQEIEEKISRLIQTDSRAIQMYEKYKEYMLFYKKRVISVDTSLLYGTTVKNKERYAGKNRNT